MQSLPQFSHSIEKAVKTGVQSPPELSHSIEKLLRTGVQSTPPFSHSTEKLIWNFQNDGAFIQISTLYRFSVEKSL